MSETLSTRSPESALTIKQAASMRVLGDLRQRSETPRKLRNRRRIEGIYYLQSHPTPHPSGNLRPRPYLLDPRTRSECPQKKRNIERKFFVKLHAGRNPILIMFHVKHCSGSCISIREPILHPCPRQEGSRKFFLGSIQGNQLKDDGGGVSRETPPPLSRRTNFRRGSEHP